MPTPEKRTPAKRQRLAAKRQRHVVVAARCTAQEASAIRDLAAKSGLSTGAFARAAMLGDAGPRAKRRPTVHQELLRQVLGHMARLGNNVNQIARQLNAGEAAHLPEIRHALRAYLDIRAAIFQALGMNQPEPHDHEP